MEKRSARYGGVSAAAAVNVGTEKEVDTSSDTSTFSQTMIATYKVQHPPPDSSGISCWCVDQCAVPSSHSDIQFE